jgi:ribosomal protein L37E
LETSEIRNWMDVALRFVVRRTRRIDYGLLPRNNTINMIPSANLEDVRVSRIECKRCGHSWFKQEGAESHVCPMCSTPYLEKEETNVIRKN